MQNSESSSTSQTAHMLDQLALLGATPSSDETDHCELPETDQVEFSIGVLFDSVSDLLSGSQLENDIEEMLWSLTNIFHRRLVQLSKQSDNVSLEIKEMITQQDGSEVRSTELERLQSKSEKLFEHITAYEGMREHATECFASETGSAWLPRTGSRISNKALTASVIDSKSYMMAKRRKETENLCPEGTRIAFSGGDYQDHHKIWSVLDATYSKYSDMILLHGGSTKGAELIAAKWADARNVT
ncbi:DUF2493 domain-containing protein [Lentilitoribacter sp. EG35]|uniref:DUF2493 domain-containing protein n=1 Tax=Lentilitoribacter sp. EG35 TaxID=3234192 RepID=UPI0034606DD2